LDIERGSEYKRFIILQNWKDSGRVGTVRPGQGWDRYMLQ